ncbi:MAG: glycoside hydrolase family 3 C-terminal domain-containing protein [Gemmatimonadetes bacterium]|nr:glycoside hydrolase family 3 C-terminal domain-containing protein [Gemmatimonadota bacterium]
MTSLGRHCARIGVVAASVAMWGAGSSSGRVEPYRDRTRSVDDRVADLLARMTLEEKVWQLYMSPGDPQRDGALLRHGIYGLQLMPEPGDTVPMAPGARAHRLAERVNRVQRFFRDSTRLGIPALLFEEGVHGLVQPGATVFPSAIALAATFDTALAARVAGVIAREARSRGVRQLLSPVLNLARDPRWGRVEETFGEDPRLAADLATAMVAPLEGAGITTTPKHLIANAGDGGRDSWPVPLSSREIERVHAPPFRAAITAGARSVMAAYNAVDGVPAAQNRALLTDRLRRAWGFGGVVISDAAGVGGANVLHFTARDYADATIQAFAAGLDVIFQSEVAQARLFMPPLLDGRVPRATIDSAVARVLRLKFALGLFDDPFVDERAIMRTLTDTASVGLARETARRSIVLLRNERQLLPLASTVRRVAVIGADALEARLGGYTPAGAHAPALAEALRAALGAGVRVRTARGVPRIARALVPIPATALAHDSGGRLVPGLAAEYYADPSLGGVPRVVRTDSAVDFAWPLNGPVRGLPRDWYGVRWQGVLRPDTTGTLTVGVEGNDGWRLLVGDSVVDATARRGHGVRTVRIAVRAGEPVRLHLTYRETNGHGRIRLVWNRGVRVDDDARIAEAVAAARSSDVAIIGAGIEEGEFRDRASLELPGRQNALIRAVAATGTPVVVVLTGGGAIRMPWIDDARAVLLGWYGGAEGSRAMVDVLTGRADPAGRLPFTIPATEGQLPLTYDHEPTGRGDDYLDRSGLPQFPFGFGMSYGVVTYDSLAIDGQPVEDGPAPRPARASDSVATGARRAIAVRVGVPVTVRLRVRNVGLRDGDEVVQLYVRHAVARTAQPVLAFVAARRVSLRARESRTVTFTLAPGDLAPVNADGLRLPVPADVHVLVGASSRDLRLRAVLRVE